MQLQLLINSSLMAVKDGNRVHHHLVKGIHLRSKVGARDHLNKAGNSLLHRSRIRAAPSAESSRQRRSSSTTSNLLLHILHNRQQLSREKFAQFSKHPIADPTTHALALYSFSVASRDEVDSVSDAALAAGAREADGAEDYGFMYSRSFFDLDGHGWQVMWMDPVAAEQGPEAVAAHA